MARSRKRDQLWRAAKAGLTDMPGNAAWVLSRALKPATSAARDSSAAPAAVLQNVSDTASAAAQSAHDASIEHEPPDQPAQAAGPRALCGRWPKGSLASATTRSLR